MLSPKEQKTGVSLFQFKTKVFNRRNTLGMNRTVCLCLWVRRVVKEGGNGIRGNTFGRGGRAT